MKISLSRVLAFIIVVLGLTVTFIPKYIFPICESGDLGFFGSDEPVMRCFWFGRIEMFLGGLVVLSGLILFFRQTTGSCFATGTLLIGIGLVIILVSLNTVIGSTCSHMHSICQVGTKPAERIAGSLIAILGLVFMLLPGKTFGQK